MKQFAQSKYQYFPSLYPCQKEELFAFASLAQEISLMIGSTFQLLLFRLRRLVFYNSLKSFDASLTLFLLKLLLDHSSFQSPNTSSINSFILSAKTRNVCKSS